MHDGPQASYRRCPVRAITGSQWRRLGNVVDQRRGGPITIGYGRYGPNESIRENIAVDDVMIILEGRISVSSDAGEETAGPDEIIYMPKGSSLTISAHDEGAVTAYVTYPHWQDPTASNAASA